jgi:hypothetical protein
MPEMERDEHGHVRLAELELDRLLARQVKDREDLSDPGKLGPIAAASGLTPEAFRDRYGYFIRD